MTLSSLEEKNAYFKKHGELEKWLYVEELIRLAQRLPRDWWLTPTPHNHLAVHRLIEVDGEEKQELLGQISFSASELDMFNCTGELPGPPFPNERPNEVIWKEFNDPEKDGPELEEDLDSKVCLVFIPLKNRVNGMLYPYLLGEFVKSVSDEPAQWYDEMGCKLTGVSHYAELHYWM